MAATDGRNWLAMLRRYIAASAVLHLAWEALHFPLYTYWRTESWAQIAYDIAHCTLGDVMIATATLVAAIVVAGRSDWPAAVLIRVGALAIVLGAGYTVYSEWLNVVVRKSWAYAAAMPLLPLVGTGLTPLLQWLVVPAIALAVAARCLPPTRP